MLTITGGKLTTWRRMAEQTVDRIVERSGRSVRCQTAEIPLGMEIDPAELVPPEGVSDDSLRQLAFRYGHAAREVLKLAEAEPALARPILPGMPDLMAEVAFATRFEQARGIDDVLLRRTRIGLTSASSFSSSESVREVALLMGSLLGWSKAEIRRQCDAWVETVRMEGLDPSRSGGL
jgi:glycerol-3-phosphate dehydrogenase